MRILYDHQVFSLQTYGGVTRVFCELISYLNAQPGIRTDLLLGFSPNRTDFDSLVSAPGRVFRPGPAIFKQPKFNYAVNEAFSSILAPMLGKYDIYHSTYYRYIPTVKASRRVVTHHDCAPEVLPQLFPNREYLFRVRRKLYSEADLILCVSASSRADLLHYYDIPPEKAIVVHNGVTPMQRQIEGAGELQAAIQGDFLLYVGARYSYKNFDSFLHSFAASEAARKHRLLVVGGGPASAGHLALIEALGLQGRIVFVPYGSSALLAEAYARTALLVYPSLYEGFGMPPLEAASIGCVSLVASSPATREICQDAVFFFEPHIRGHFTEMLDRALGDREERARLSTKARQLAAAFSWAECGRKTLAAYCSLL